MTNTEIAGWLREAAENAHDDHWYKIAELFEDRAALVESMACGSCRWWDELNGFKDRTGVCLNVAQDNTDKWHDTRECGPDFGCIHWEVKEGK